MTNQQILGRNAAACCAFAAERNEELRATSRTRITGVQVEALGLEAAKKLNNAAIIRAYEKQQQSVMRRAQSGKKNTPSFSKEDDRIIVQHVNKHGSSNWNLVAERLGRDVKSVANRYRQYLQVGNVKTTLNTDDLQRLIVCVREKGTKWIDIIRGNDFFSGFAQQTLKNGFNQWLCREKNAANIAKKKVRRLTKQASNRKKNGDLTKAAIKAQEQLPIALKEQQHAILRTQNAEELEKRLKQKKRKANPDNALSPRGTKRPQARHHLRKVAKTQ